MDIRELYQQSIDRFAMNASTLQLLSQISSGTDNAQAYEELIGTDEFFIETVLTEAFPLSQEPLKTLVQSVNLLGRDRIRNFIFAHSTNRFFDAKADSHYKDFSTTLKALKRSLEAEQLARQLQLEKPEAAFPVGLIYDFLEQWLLNEPDLKSRFTSFFDNIWRHSLRTSAIATTLANHRRVKITSAKTVFAAGLLHDMGKLLLAFTQPDRYQSVMLDSKILQKSSPRSDDYEIDLETEALGLAHPEAASLFLWQLEHLKELEALTEYHHDFTFLPIRNAELNMIEVIVSIADKVAFFLESSNTLDLTTVTEILKPHTKFFRVNPSDTLDALITLRANSTVV